MISRSIIVNESINTDNKHEIPFKHNDREKGDEEKNKGVDAHTMPYRQKKLPCVCVYGDLRSENESE